MDVINEILADVRDQNATAAWDRLSQEAKLTISEVDVARLMQRISRNGFNAKLQSVDDQTVANGRAEIEITLSLDFRGLTLPQKDVAFLVAEDGRWKLADHFLQTLETVTGLAPAPTVAARAFGRDGCVHGDVMAGVWLPSRLTLHEACVTVEGTVLAVEPATAGEGDGDLTFEIEVSSGDKRLLDASTRNGARGTIHVEVVPADQPGNPEPKVGQRVKVQGAWVTDTIHNLDEVHPAWKVSVLN